MSEYIVKTDGEYGMYRDGLFVLEDEYMAVPAEPIVRCRDCAKPRTEHEDGETWLYCDQCGYVEPLGFCAWAERKVK